MIGKRDLRGAVIEHSIIAGKSLPVFGHISLNFAALFQVSRQVDPTAFRNTKGLLIAV